MVFYILLSADPKVQKSSELNIPEVFVAQGLLGCDAVVGVELQHALDYFQAVEGDEGQQVLQVLLAPFREGGLGVGQLLYARPLLGGWGAQD
jgi:hypothetical protein